MKLKSCVLAMMLFAAGIGSANAVPVVYQGELVYGMTKTGSITDPFATGTDWWFFHANTGDVITLTVFSGGIMHGEEDTRVDPGQSLELYRALKVRKPEVPVRLVFYPGEGHGNRKAASRYDYNLRMMRWFDTYLKTGDRRAPLPAPRPQLPESAAGGSSSDDCDC